jgi:predicted GIY-YIG superfamily endonuclease
MALAIYICALMSLGSIFAFGLWGEDFALKFGWTAGELAFVYSCGAIGNYSCLFPGWVCDQQGPRSAIRIGMLLLVLGWAGIFLGLRYGVEATYVGAAYFLEEQGNAFVYMGITMDALARFPTRMTGTVNGVTSAAYGLGAVVWTSVHAICSQRTALAGEQPGSELDLFLPAVAVCTLIAGFTAWMLALPTPEGKGKTTQQKGTMQDLLALGAFACFSLAPVCSLLGYLGTCAHDLGIESLTLFANTAFVLCTLGRVLVGVAFDSLGAKANAVGAMAVCGAGFSVAFYKLGRLALVHVPHDGRQIEAMGTLYVLLFLYGGLGPVLTCAVYERFGAESAGTVIGGISVAVSIANALISAHVQLVPGHLSRPLLFSAVTCLLSIPACAMLVKPAAKSKEVGEKTRLLGEEAALPVRRVVQVV